MGGGSEKSAVTLILGGTSEGLLYPPVVLLGGMNRIDKEIMKVGERWNLNKSMWSKDPVACYRLTEFINNKQILVIKNVKG